MDIEYSYKCFPSEITGTDEDSIRIKTAKLNFGAKPEDECYVICVDGEMNTVCFESAYPFKKTTTEESAQAHINFLKEEAEKEHIQKLSVESNLKNMQQIIDEQQKVINDLLLQNLRTEGAIK